MASAGVCPILLVYVLVFFFFFFKLVWRGAAPQGRKRPGSTSPVRDSQSAKRAKCNCSYYLFIPHLIYFFSTKQRSCPAQEGVPVTPTLLTDKKVFEFHSAESLSIVNHCNQCHGSVQFPLSVTKMKTMRGAIRVGPRLFDSLVWSQVLAESTPRRTMIKPQVILPLRMRAMIPMRKTLTMVLMTFVQWMVMLLRQHSHLK